MAKIPTKPSTKGTPPAPARVIDNLARPEREPLVTLGFKTSPTFQREFKAYAAAHGISMRHLLERAFEVIKREQSWQNS
jgi:hypothetical protein